MRVFWPAFYLHPANRSLDPDSFTLLLRTAAAAERKGFLKGSYTMASACPRGERCAPECRGWRLGV